MGTAEKAYDFSVRIAEIVRYLKADDREFPLSDRLLGCGVSAGLSVREGEWKAAAEWVRQTDYIIEMAVRGGYLTGRQGLPIREECAALLTALENMQEGTGRGKSKDDKKGENYYETAKK